MYKSIYAVQPFHLNQKTSYLPSIEINRFTEYENRWVDEIDRIFHQNTAKANMQHTNMTEDNLQLSMSLRFISTHTSGKTSRCIGKEVMSTTFSLQQLVGDANEYTFYPEEEISPSGFST